MTLVLVREMACGCIARTILIFINTVFTLLGVAMMWMSTKLKEILVSFGLDLDRLAKEIEQGLSSGSPGAGALKKVDLDGILELIKPVLMYSGAVLTLYGICGLTAVCNKLMLKIYTVLTVLLQLAELALVLVLMGSYVKTRIKTYLTDTIINNYTGLDDLNTNALFVNFLMLYDKCCGVDDYKIFQKSKTWINKRSVTRQGVTVDITLKTPIACCVMKGQFPSVKPVNEECSVNPTGRNNNFQKGCYPILENKYDDAKMTMTPVLLALIASTIACLISSIQLLFEK